MGFEKLSFGNSKLPVSSNETITANTMAENPNRALGYRSTNSETPSSPTPKPFIEAINGLAIAAGMERAAPESVAHFIVTTIVRVTPLGNQIRYKGRPSRYS